MRLARLAPHASRAPRRGAGAAHRLSLPLPSCCVPVLIPNPPPHRPPPTHPTHTTRPPQVGRMVLNRNPDNFFNENEQLAFCPALVVPGA